MKFNDWQIRKAFYQNQIYPFLFHPDILVVDECDLLQGKARIDVLIIGNRHLHGYEIKSDKDNTKRLPRQSVIYGRSLHRVTLITASKHLDEALKVIPYWWGIILVTSKNDLPSFKRLRKSLLNPDILKSSLVKMLWKIEAFVILQKHGIIQHKETYRPRYYLWKKLEENLSLETLQEEICFCLRTRKDWGTKVYLGENAILNRI